jgi:hypothetical protein
MISERAPGTAVAIPGKATRADDEDVDTQDEAEQVEQPATERRRSVFDAPLQTDLDAQHDDNKPEDG